MIWLLKNDPPFLWYFCNSSICQVDTTRDVYAIKLYYVSICFRLNFNLTGLYTKATKYAMYANLSLEEQFPIFCIISGTGKVYPCNCISIKETNNDEYTWIVHTHHPRQQRIYDTH